MNWGDELQRRNQEHYDRQKREGEQRAQTERFQREQAEGHQDDFINHLNSDLRSFYKADGELFLLGFTSADPKANLSNSSGLYQPPSSENLAFGRPQEIWNRFTTYLDTGDVLENLRKLMPTDWRLLRESLFYSLNKNENLYQSLTFRGHEFLFVNVQDGDTDTTLKANLQELNKWREVLADLQLLSELRYSISENGYVRTSLAYGLQQSEPMQNATIDSLRIRVVNKLSTLDDYSSIPFASTSRLKVEVDPEICIKSLIAIEKGGLANYLKEIPFDSRNLSSQLEIFAKKSISRLLKQYSEASGNNDEMSRISNRIQKLKLCSDPALLNLLYYLRRQETRVAANDEILFSVINRAGSDSPRRVDLQRLNGINKILAEICPHLIAEAFQVHSK